MLSNLPLKTLAIALAALLWLHVATDKTYEVEQMLPVAVALTSENRALVNAPPDSLLTLISATGKALMRGGWREKGVSIRIGETRIGRRELELTTENVTLLDGSGLTLQSIVSPRNHRFTLDVVDSAMLPVKSQITVVPAAGFILGSVGSLIPTKVRAIGPKSVIRRLVYAATENKSERNVSNDIVLNAAIDTTELYGVIFTPSQVTYRAKVTAVRQKAMDNVSIALLNAPAEGAALNPGAINLIVSGALDEIQSLSVADISVTADFIRRDSAGVCPLTVSLPRRLTLISISDSTTRIYQRDSL